MALISAELEMWIIAAHVPEGADYQGTMDAIRLIIESFSPVEGA